MSRSQLSEGARTELERKVDMMFDRLLARFVGVSGGPKVIGFEIVAEKELSLPGMFTAAAAESGVPELRSDTLKSLARISANYIGGVKEQTKARLIHTVDNAIARTETEDEASVMAELEGQLMVIWGKSTAELRRILETEISNAKNEGSHEGIARMSASIGIPDPVVFKIPVRDNFLCLKCKQLWLMPDLITPRLYYMSELKHGYMDHKCVQATIGATHPHCVVGHGGTTKVLTEQDGWKVIKQVEPGDRVLTDKGRFKEVTADLSYWDKKYKGQRITIELLTARKKSIRIILTPEHKLKTNLGWVEVKDLTKKHKLISLAIECPECKKIHKFDHTNSVFCGKGCASKFTTRKQWADPKHRKNISEKTSKYMKAQHSTKEGREKYLKNIQAANKKTRELVANGKFWAQKSENLPILRKNMIANNCKMQLTVSGEQRRVYDLVKEIYPSAIMEVPAYHWTLDIVIPELNVNIEYDGGGHYIPVYQGKMTMDQIKGRDKGRDFYLSKCGWHVIRYSKIPSLKQISEDVSRVSSNSENKYSFIETDILSIKKSSEKVYDNKPVRLYDITVADDESFILSGIVSKNCRCTLTFLMPGYGFSATGEIGWIEEGHQEIKKQR